MYHSAAPKFQKLLTFYLFISMIESILRCPTKKCVLLMFFLMKTCDLQDFCVVPLKTGSVFQRACSNEDIIYAKEKMSCIWVGKSGNCVVSLRPVVLGSGPFYFAILFLQHCARSFILWRRIPEEFRGCAFHSSFFGLLPEVDGTQSFFEACGDHLPFRLRILRGGGGDHPT